MVGHPPCTGTEFWLSKCKQDPPDCKGTVSRRSEATVRRHECQHHRTWKAPSGSRYWLTNPEVISDDNFQASVKLTAPLVAVTQDQTFEIDPNDIFVAKTEIRASNHRHSEDRANTIYSQLMPEMKRCVDITKERGSSSWVSVLPLLEHGFHLQKGEFKDALCLRYGWSLSNTPQLCNCGKAFTVNHAMVCYMGGFPTIRHNEMRDLTASLITEVCPNVAIEPHLQPLSESFRLASTNTDDGARFDVRARGIGKGARMLSFM